MSSILSTPLEVLKYYWNYPVFRPLQQEIIESVLSGHDTLALLPTGGGKSITFQVPGLILGGITLVITPLVSLMKDQVHQLRMRGIPAYHFSAGMSAKEVRTIRERIAAERCRFLYVSPERLQSVRFVDELRNMNIKLIAVDEAHCISQWGYDFRPSYLMLGRLRQLLPDVSVLALTATATPDVTDDIRRQLQFRAGHNTFTGSFHRPNIHYIVRHAPLKMDEVLHILQRTSGSSIIYARSRKRTRELSNFLNQEGLNATYYHAGLESEEKDNRQTLWQEGKIRIICATNAFGMGINKPDVRVVIHYDIPPSLEEYYQEAGRAGRDGLLSYAVLLRSKRDRTTLHRHLKEAFPERSVILKIYERICNFLEISIGEGENRLYPFNMGKFIETFGLKERQLRSVLTILTAASLLTFIDETDTKARVMVVAPRQELYDMQFSETAETVLKILLRTYPGLNTEYAEISEHKICAESGYDMKTVLGALLELSRAHCLSYIPRRRTPYILILQRRNELKYVKIGRNAYEDRYNVMKHRLDAIENYVYAENKCRVQMLLEYFGEHRSQKCGTCDTCRAMNAHRNPISDKDVLQAILSILSQAKYPLAYEAIVDKITRGKNRVKYILVLLCQEGFAYEEHGFYRINELKCK